MIRIQNSCQNSEGNKYVSKFKKDYLNQFNYFLKRAIFETDIYRL